MEAAELQGKNKDGHAQRELLKILGLVPGLSLIKRLPAMAAAPVKPTSENSKVSVFRSVNGTTVVNDKGSSFLTNSRGWGSLIKGLVK